MSHPNGPRTGRPPMYATNAMVATSHGLASVSGLDVLQRGGSAVDAAIAANAVLCVAYPHMAGLGGDGFWLIGRRGSDEVTALNASGPAAAMAEPAYYRELGHDDAIPSRGPLGALTVPGAVDGWRQAHERHGRIEWPELFSDAVRLADEGVPVSRSLEDWTAKDVPVLSEREATAQIFLPGGRAPRMGQLLRQPALAESFRTIAQHGARSGFYEGAIAERICSALEGDGSPLRSDDFAAFHADWVDPITTDYRGHTVVEFPPNTQGFVALQILGMLEGFDVSSWGDTSIDYLHHAAEIVKLAFADRDEWLTDPKFVDLPLDRLLDPGYLRERSSLIDPERAMTMEHVEPGVSFGGAADRQPAGGDTCAFQAVDADGLVVSVIQSIYHDFGTAVVGGDTGILLQNRGSHFSLDDDHPNVLAPHKRTFHTLIPGMVLRDGEPLVTFGTMGGEGQPQTHAALLTRLVDFGYDVQQAIEAPRWLMGRTWGAESQDLSLEGRIPDEVIRELERRGQPVKMLADWNDNMGHAQAIRLGPEGLEGGADPRGDGLALGF